MKAKDLICGALQMTEEAIARLVSDLRDAPLTQPTSNGGNHPLWVLGHLAFVEGTIPQIAFGDANPVESWAPLFAPGSQPQPDASLYPSFDELLAKFRELREKNIQRLKSLDDEALDLPPKAIPAGFEDAMRTIGQTFLLVCLHEMVHYGQVADARRAAGLKPLM